MLLSFSSPIPSSDVKLSCRSSLTCCRYKIVLLSGMKPAGQRCLVCCATNSRSQSSNGLSSESSKPLGNEVRLVVDADSNCSQALGTLSNKLADGRRRQIGCLLRIIRLQCEELDPTLAVLRQTDQTGRRADEPKLVEMQRDAANRLGSPSNNPDGRSSATCCS